MEQEQATLGRFDAAEYVESEDDVAAFLEEALRDESLEVIALPLDATARARNVSQLARETGMTRAGLYKALAPGANPSFGNAAKIAQARRWYLKVGLPG